ncbi:MAG: F0F1 ATP synthase subunit alpha [Mycoplasmataceae bacterium]|nr:F0F1 ATP synthase subunit alpha [Mycoplasmataceae bacterium]
MKNKDNYIEFIRAEIDKYSEKTDFNETGKVISINDGVAVVSGLKNAMLSEVVIFENKTKGMIMNLENSIVVVLILGQYKDIKEKSEVIRTKSIISIPIGTDILGRVLSPLGDPLDDLGIINNKRYSLIEKPAAGIMERSSVNEPLQTGILLIDSMIPIGKGQRELIVGDRQTGKTTIAINTIINQKGKNVKCVYVSIGQKNSSLAKIIKKLDNAGALQYTTIISASASDFDANKYLAPYSGIAIAEEWMNKGEDVLIVFDDLTKHAFAYRSISLLLKRPSGRESYPGDIFYLHSRLLERACKLKEKGSITALPIIETQNNDISTYIPTNVISITDGQLFLQTNLFNLGQKPAINVELSVSRIGSSAQNKVIKKLASSVKIALAQYYDMLSFSQFGNEVDDDTKIILEKGKRINWIIKQNESIAYEWIVEAQLLYLIFSNTIVYIPFESMGEFKNYYIQSCNESETWKQIEQMVEINKEQIEELNKWTLNLIYDFVSKLGKNDNEILKLIKKQLK